MSTNSKSITEIVCTNPTPQLRVVIHEDKRPEKQQKRRYNAPTSNEVGILMPNEPSAQRDVVLHQRDGPLQHISELHRAYDPLQYPLLFPYDTDGYSIYLHSETGRKITQMQYYAYHLQCRATNYLHLGRDLYQQFVVDMYCKIESERLHYIRREQKTLRADTYHHDFCDSILHSDADPNSIGRRVILPSSYTGGPRYMYERQQDAITYVRRYGRPSLFITTTTNPKWPEILGNLQPHQHAPDRPDIVARVFHHKLLALMKLIKDGVFGDVQAWLYAVEFQKRGLPYGHILVWLTSTSKITLETIDSIISVEIPCPTTQPILHTIVTSNMIHRPCGAFNPKSPCMQDGKCTKSFAKDFQQTTLQGNDGYPKYRRRMPDDGGHTTIISMHMNGQKLQEIVDNRWVVPYNPWLLRQMNCHSNVEICSSVHSIKYVLKYIHKGSDQAIFSLQGDAQDEIKQYQYARFVGSMEAAHRILGFPMHQHYPPVTTPAIHLQNSQRVYFNETNAMAHALADAPKTTLTEFFTLCAKDPFAQSLLYVQVPEYYTWDNKTKTWNRRKRGTPHPHHQDIFHSACVGRVYSVNPKQSECYFLRLLLHELPGPTSYEHLRTASNTTYDTFRETCQARGLLQDDQHLHRALEEAAASNSPSQLRQLMSVILVNCEPSQPTTLWEQHKDARAEDYLHTHSKNNPAMAYNLCLAAIEELLLRIPGCCKLPHYGLPAAQHQQTDTEFLRYTNFNIEEQKEYVHHHEHQLTKEQLHVYQQLLTLINQDHPDIIFLDAPGGTGKIFMLNLLLAKVRSTGAIAIPTASSGIAATLLSGGRTLHSMFKVPLDAPQMDTPTCAIKKGTSLSKIINQYQLLIVDEAPMAHRTDYKAIDRTVQDIRDNQLPFGGIPTVLCGDFRQILPVVKNGTRANVVDATLRKSHLWPHVRVLQLTTNMRAALTNNSASQAFSDLLITIGDGQQPITATPDTITIPDVIQTTESAADLNTAIYGDLNTRAHEPNGYCPAPY
ncbi:uncharacterized protein LOC135484172 [Lineus longissimus]|uniref:uncharacterized protein LOC135484172 n=1 Tax=Lineus longissimus TaxID=88925 RepID=UPI00315CBA5B